MIFCGITSFFLALLLHVVKSICRRIWIFIVWISRTIRFITIRRIYFLFFLKFLRGRIVLLFFLLFLRWRITLLLFLCVTVRRVDSVLFVFVFVSLFPRHRLLVSALMDPAVPSPWVSAISSCNFPLAMACVLAC